MPPSHSPCHWLLALALSGCFYGAGPVIGYGEKGFVWGGEATTGFAAVSANVGWQSTHHGYAVLAFDYFADQNAGHVKTVGYALGSVRVGAGLSAHDDDIGGVVIAGGGVATGLHDADVGYQSGECNDKWSDELNVTIELRYVRQFEIVLVPRYERENIVCGGH